MTSSLEIISICHDITSAFIAHRCLLLLFKCYPEDRGDNEIFIQSLTSLIPALAVSPHQLYKYRRALSFFFLPHFFFLRRPKLRRRLRARCRRQARPLHHPEPCP